VVGERSYSKERKLLNAISTLKRAAGIPNSARERDGDYKELPGHFEIFVPDSNSADILSNLICQSWVEVIGDKAKTHGWSEEHTRIHCSNIYAKAEKQDQDIRIVISILPDEMIPLAETLNKKARSLIAPDKNPRLLKKPRGYDFGH
jgi:hypothetical protein